MIKINHKSKKTKQNFHLFTEESWKNLKSDFKYASPYFSGKKGETFVLAGDAVDILIGLGKTDELKGFEVQSVANKFANDFKEKLKPVSTSVFGLYSNEFIEEFVKGLFLGTYKYPFEKSHPFWEEKFELYVEQIAETKGKEIAKTTEALCNGQFAGMDWLNKPANFKTESQLSKFIQTECKSRKIGYKKLNRKDCEKEGLGAYLAVNQGSAQDAAFTILAYKGGGKKTKTIGLVGKCVLFDTGGISIKPSENMHYMKSDMGGATAVLGTLFAVADLKLAVNIVAILPITDNAVSERAYLPSDVITAYNGKTIEVLNTDAEGRMTLADGLSYMAKNYKTDVLIDLATLTGSSVRMFGNTCAAYFSNNDQLKNQLEISADKTNQRLWNMPLWDVWKEDFKSDVADFKNISSKPFGDCIVAAKFLEQFTENHPNWAHLDIAGVAFGNVNYTKEKAATGYGVQLLLGFIENLLKTNSNKT